MGKKKFLPGEKGYWLMEKEPEAMSREQIAVAFMQGLLANPNKWYAPKTNLAALALKYADAFIAEAAKGDKIPEGGDTSGR